MSYDEILTKLRTLANPKNIKRMARFGIRPKSKIYGINIPVLRKLAKQIGRNHLLALKLWESNIREAKITAAMIDNPLEVTEKQIEKWVNDFDSWDICDGVCGNLFDKTKFSGKKVFEWSKKEKEFVKRAAFSLLAWLAVHNKQLKNKDFIKFLPIIKKESIDERNFVKKAVNWALREIGKRNLNLNQKAIKTAKEIQKINSKSAKWIASDAIRELTNSKIKNRLLNRNGNKRNKR